MAGERITCQCCGERLYGRYWLVIVAGVVVVRCPGCRSAPIVAPLVYHPMRPPRFLDSLTLK